MHDGAVDLQLGCAASKIQPGSRPAAQARAFGPARPVRLR